MEATATQISPKDKIIAQAKSAAFHGPNYAQGIAALSELEFPTTRVEDWKYTRTTRISSEVWDITPSENIESIDSFLIPDLDASTLVFVNGHLQEKLSTIFQDSDFETSNISENSIARTAYSSIFQAMGDALCTSQLRIGVAQNTSPKKAVHIIHVCTAEQVLAQPSIQIVVGKSAACHVVETFATLTEAKSFTNRTLFVSVAENASIHLDKIQIESDSSFLLNEENIRIARNGRATINTLSVDGGWIRNNLNISLDGENIEANLHGIYLPRNRQHIDNHTKVDHRFPHCNSNELYKGLLNNQGTGVFNGKVYVQPDAQKTNAFQSNANILLSDDAQMNTKPELEIYADDVKCSHGTTTGQLDEEAMFYLKSRGLGEDNAKKLLTTAFINDVLNKIENEPVKNYVTSELVKRDLLLI
jgi:Fe-S cluster assembly protein SufD